MSARPPHQPGPDPDQGGECWRCGQACAPGERVCARCQARYHGDPPESGGGRECPDADQDRSPTGGGPK